MQFGSMLCTVKVPYTKITIRFGLILSIALASARIHQTMKQRCELLKLKAFLAFVSSQQYAQMYANHTLKDFSLYRKSFAANSLIKPNSIRQMKQKNRSEYCELFLRNLFFSFIFIDAVPPIRKRFAMKHFAATKFFFLSVFSFAVGVVIVVRC